MFLLYTCYQSAVFWCQQRWWMKIVHFLHFYYWWAFASWTDDFLWLMFWLWSEDFVLNGQISCLLIRRAITSVRKEDLCIMLKEYIKSLGDKWMIHISNKNMNILIEKKWLLMHNPIAKSCFAAHCSDFILSTRTSCINKNILITIF